MGKEGRQASSFADFAIMKFKFLRRLMFWHGANFGYTLVNFMNIIITKSIVTGTAKMWYNCWAGFSAMDFIDTYFFVSYKSLATQYGWYLWNEQQFDSQLYGEEEEKKLGFKLYENYAMVRDHFIKRVKRRFIFFQSATFYSGFTSFYIPMYALWGAVNKDGLTWGINDIGMCSQMCWVFLNHLNFNIIIRQYNKPMKIFVMVTFIVYV